MGPPERVEGTMEPASDITSIIFTYKIFITKGLYVSSYDIALALAQYFAFCFIETITSRFASKYSQASYVSQLVFILA